MRYTWDYYANLAKQIAKRIVTGDEVNKDGVRLIQVVYKQDMYATDALNMKYARVGSKASIHTYAGGIQEIATEHSDGNQGLFKSNGQYQPTENNMDKEILNYMRKNLGESASYKNRIRLTESQLRSVIKESVKKVLKENVGMSNLGQISCNGITIKFELGHTLQEWKKTFGNVDPYNEQTLWDVSIEDLLNGGIEPQEDMVYWLINGRMYETM